MRHSCHNSPTPAPSRLFFRLASVAAISTTLLGCGPSAEEAADSTSEAVEATTSTMVDSVAPADAGSPPPSSEPATVVDFSTWSGKSVEWTIAEGKENHLYADNDFTNKTAPNLVVAQWIGDTPELNGEKFLLVDFWATWCPPCRALIPELNEVAKEFSDDLIVVGLSDESVETVLDMKEPVMEYYRAVDGDARMKSQIGVQGIPHVMLIDPSGKVAWQGFPVGAEDPLTAERLKEIISQYRSL